jgi:cysteine desulfurase
MYLDHNATSPMSEPVRAAMLEAMASAWGNPSSAHSQGQRASMLVDSARAQVAALVGRPAKDVTFTGGATEANTWALSQATDASRTEVVISAVEHPSVAAWGTRTVDVDGNGVIRLDQLADAIDDSVAIVSVMAANNETGVLQPVREVAELCRAAGVVSHCDASQLPGRLAVDLDADWITLAAHKFGGPPGVGALIAANPPPPLLRGGGQERGRRGGTLNVPAIVGMGAAAALAVEAGQMPRTQRDQLEAVCVELGGRIIGDQVDRLPNTIMVLFEAPGDLIVTALDLEGISASTGSACASGSSTTSHVLAAMGLDGIPVRFSLGRDSQVDAVIPILQRILARMEHTCAS